MESTPTKLIPTGVRCLLLAGTKLPVNSNITGIRKQPAMAASLLPGLALTAAVVHDRLRHHKPGSAASFPQVLTWARRLKTS
jgi:hypothetical protein